MLNFDGVVYSSLRIKATKGLMFFFKLRKFDDSHKVTLHFQYFNPGVVKFTNSWELFNYLTVVRLSNVKIYNLCTYLVCKRKKYPFFAGNHVEQNWCLIKYVVISMSYFRRIFLLCDQKKVPILMVPKSSKKVLWYYGLIVKYLYFSCLITEQIFVPVVVKAQLFNRWSVLNSGGVIVLKTFFGVSFAAYFINVFFCVRLFESTCFLLYACFVFECLLCLSLFCFMSCLFSYACLLCLFLFCLYTYDQVLLQLNVVFLDTIKQGTFVTLQSLQHLDLTNNLISTIEGGSFEGLRKLTSLLLTHNKLTKFNSDIFHGADNLKELNLAENFITEFPSVALKAFSELGTLNLSSNLIQVSTYYLSN